MYCNFITCMILFLKGYQKYDRSKLKALLLSNDCMSFNFDLSYFWIPYRYRVIQYLIEKLSDMAKMIQKSKVVAALSTSIRTSWKVGIYYINRALFILNLAPLYIHQTHTLHAILIPTSLKVQCYAHLEQCDKSNWTNKLLAYKLYYLYYIASHNTSNAGTVKLGLSELLVNYSGC